MRAALPLLLLSIGAALGAAPAGTVATDPRLGRMVRVSAADEPLGRLLPRLGAELRVSLRASREVAEEKVTLSTARERPAGEVLERLARHTGFRWRRSAAGWELYQDDASRRREARRRDEDLDRQLAAMVAEVDRTAAPATPAGAAERIRQMWRSAPRTATPDERARWVAELEKLQRECAAPHAATVFQSLNAPQLRQLRDRGELLLSSTDGTLPAQLVGRIHQLGADLAEESRNETVQAHVDVRLAEEMPPAIGPPARPEPRLVLRITLASLTWLKPPDPGQPPPPREGPDRPFCNVSLHTWSPVPPEPPSAVDRPRGADEPLLRREVDLGLSRRADTGGLPSPAPSQRIVFAAGGAWPADWVTVGEIARRLAEKSGLDVMADSFTRARLAPEKLSGRRSLAQIGEGLAKELRCGLYVEDGAVHIRSEIRHWDRIREVPDSLLKPWRERVLRAETPGEPTLDQLSELAAALTDRQCRSLHEYWGWYLANERAPIPPPAPGGFYPLRQHLRLWASLNRLQRGQALSGAVVPARTMTDAQRRLFLAGFLSVKYDEYLPLDRRRYPTLEEVAAGGLSLKSERLYEQEYVGTHEFGDRMVRSTRSADPAKPRPLERDPLDDEEAWKRWTWKAVGTPLRLLSVQFNYHLAGEPKPARTASMDVLTPRPRA